MKNLLILGLAFTTFSFIIGVGNTAIELSDRYGAEIDAFLADQFSAWL